MDRITNGTGKVSQMSLKEIKELNVKLGEKIPTFEEVIEIMGGRIGMNIHMYVYGKALDRTVNICREAGILDEVFFALSDPSEIRRLVKTYPDVYVCSGYGAAGDRYLEDSIELEARILQPPINAHYLTSRWVERAHQNGLIVEVFWADTSEKMISLRDIGVDGILTNFPDIFIETFRR